MTQQYIDEMAQSMGVDFRANVPEGTVLGTEEIQAGAQATWKKGRSGVRMGAISLPERQLLYDKWTHDVSNVPPPIAMKRMTSNPARYTTLKPKDWDDTAPKPIDETCEFCERRRQQESPGAPPKPFYDPWVLQEHKRLVHTSEWQGAEQDRRDAEAREDRRQMRELIATIAGQRRGRPAKEDADGSD